MRNIALHIVALVSLCACGPTYGVERDDRDPFAAAVDVFAAEHGAPSDRCVDAMLDARWYPMNAAELAADCGAEPGEVSACTHFDPQRVSVLETLQFNAAVAEHEALHMLLQCELRTSDVYHRDRVWPAIGQIQGVP